MIAVKIMMSNLATGRLKADSWKQRLGSAALFLPQRCTKTHSSCRIRSFMCLRMKPLLTTCLSPKAIIGEGAPFQHLNPKKKKKMKKKRCMLSCHPLRHFSDIFSELIHEWWSVKIAVILKDRWMSAHTIQLQGIKPKKKWKTYSPAFFILLRLLATLPMKTVNL